MVLHIQSYFYQTNKPYSYHSLSEKRNEQLKRKIVAHPKFSKYLSTRFPTLKCKWTKSMFISRYLTDVGSKLLFGKNKLKTSVWAKVKITKPKSTKAKIHNNIYTYNGNTIQSSKGIKYRYML